MKGVTVALLLLVVLAAPALSQAPDDKLIVPDERIGRFTLTMTVAEVLGMLGPATRLSPSMFGDQSLQNVLTLYIWDVVPLTIITRDEKVPLSIGIRRSNDYQTAQESGIWRSPKQSEMLMGLRPEKSSGAEGPRS